MLHQRAISCRVILAISLVFLVVPLGKEVYVMAPANARSDGSPCESEVVKLPDPRPDSTVSIERTLRERRSVRNYQDQPLTLEELGQLLWSAQGITHPRGLRTAPSAGALYPVELYVAAGDVASLPSAIYKYDPQVHQLNRVKAGDSRVELARAALGQRCVERGAAVIVFAAVYERTTAKYGERGRRYVHIEVGCAAENVYLQAVSLGLGTVFVGAFYDDEVREIMNMENGEQPLGLMPVGRR